jgi:ELWxxDGT repeat protein
MKTKVLIAAIFLLSNALFSQTLTLVSDINSGQNNSFPNALTEFNRKIYFVAGNGTGYKIYSSDGTTTQLIGPTTNPNGTVYNLTKYNNKLYFTYNDGLNGLELWTSDGTSSGTIMLKDIWSGSLSSAPTAFTVCNGLLFFHASTAARNQGLWVTDGTVSGTKMLGNQYSNPFSSTNSFIVLNNKIYFQGNAGTGYGLWESNGTTEGTQLVKSGYIGSSGGSHAILGTTFYFQSGDNTSGQEIWKSDGTNAGTVLVKDINTVGFSSDPQNFFTDGQKIYFLANDGIRGRELWATDGTNSGTQIIKDVNIGIGSSVQSAGSPFGIVKFNTETYFFGYNGTAVEMYKTNGTQANTVLVKTISNISGVSYCYVFDGKIYFVGFTSVGGSEYLFESDGTATGTNQINPSINTYSTNPNGFNMLGLNSELFFPAFFENKGNEFCKISSLLGLNAIKKNQKTYIYPNPTKNELFISSETSINSIRIFNSLGQTVFTKNINSPSLVIDVDYLAKGIYVISAISDRNITENHTFIKE